MCPICSASARVERLPYPAANVRASTLAFDSIHVCEHCGGGTAWPRPTQQALDDFYGRGGYWHSVSSALQHAHEMSQGWLRVERMQPAVSATRFAVADIGAGHGGIPRALAHLRLPVSRYAFVEPDDAAAGRISSLRAPFPIQRAPALKDLGSGYDLVFLNHVLEHVSDPLAFLQEAVRHVRPGGLVYVETPHADYRFKDDVFPHTFFFTPGAFRALGARLGARTRACETFGRLPAPRTPVVGIGQRLAARALRLAVAIGWRRAQRALDQLVWRYAPTDEGIWLRWIFSTGS
jgi:2-polyprenyl-3-methyl-5-hydroxy-6-metoxy-1,4-benzoquinol methylase